jgi:hypothetical protein
MFDALNLGAYKSIVTANVLNGDILSYCTSVEDFMSMGITLRPQAAYFLAKVTEFKATGVPSTLLTPPAAPVKAAESVKATTAAATKPTVVESTPIKVVPTPETKAPTIAAIPTPTGPPNPEALLQAARDGKVEAIRTCLNNHTDIESIDTVCTLCPLSTYIGSSSLYSNSLLHVTIVILVECWFL